MTDMRVRYLAPLGLWLAAAPAISFVEGTPDPLPAAALGSIALMQLDDQQAELDRAAKRLDALEQKS